MRLSRLVIPATLALLAACSMKGPSMEELDEPSDGQVTQTPAPPSTPEEPAGGDLDELTAAVEGEDAEERYQPRRADKERADYGGAVAEDDFEAYPEEEPEPDDAPPPPATATAPIVIQGSERSNVILDGAGATRSGGRNLSRGGSRSGEAAAGYGVTGYDVAGNVAPADPGEDIGTEDYTSYGVNEMTVVEADRYSTFSIDVDTASYSIARRKLTEGRLPPTSAVRVEEFVNYFDYDYVGPTGDAPFAVNMEGSPHPFQPSHHILRFGVQGREVSAADRKPVHLTFLVDTSGSMDSADKMGLVKRSLRQLVEQLQTGDTVALATYAGSVRRVLGPTAISERDAISSAIEDLMAGGSTAMSSGVDLAYEMADAAFVAGHVNRVVVLSDGDANVGSTSHEQILEQITGYASKGITLSTIGFGMGNYQDTLMEQLANKGDGNYFYVDSFSEAQKVFGTDLAGTLEVIAKDVKIQVEFNPEAVIAYRLIGYENRDIADKDFRNDHVDAGEIGAGHQVTALYDVILKDGYRDTDVAVVRLRNKKSGPDSAAVEWETRLPARLVHDEFADASNNLRLAFGAASFAELLRGSPYTAEISYAQLLSLLDDARYGSDIDRELLELIAAAGRLSGEDITLASRP